MAYIQVLFLVVDFFSPDCGDVLIEFKSMNDLIHAEVLARISTFLGSKVNADFDVKLYVKISSPFGHQGCFSIFPYNH